MGVQGQGMTITAVGGTIRVEGPAGKDDREVLRSHLAAVPRGDVVVDLSGVTKFDSRTVEVLTGAAARFAARGDTLVLLGRAEVLNLALWLGLADFLTVERA